MKKAKILSLVEHQRFTKENIRKCGLNERESEKIFKELEDFVQDERRKDFLTFHSKGVLKARNYVGIIQTKSGFTLEILPKIAKSESIECKCQSPYKSDSIKLKKEIKKFYKTLIDKEANKEESNKIESCAYCHSKSVFLNCLKTLPNIPFKSDDFANLKAHKLPLLEIFISMFLTELDNLIKKGIKSNYIQREENRKFLKGKLLFSEHLKTNLIHKERFFTSSDEYLSDIAPNRLIVSTLLKLSKMQVSRQTSTKLMQSRFIFDGIPKSEDYKSDFEKSKITRALKDYHLILQWCELFLQNQSFMQDSGESECLTLLFDMNALFESFVAYHLKKLDSKNIIAQSSSKYLAKDSNGQNIFMLKPDLWIKNQNIICDTKWKIINDKKEEKYGISQSDMYQMWAYATKFKAKKIVLIYPLCEATKNLGIPCEHLEFKADEEVKVYIRFFPLDIPR